MTDLIMQDWTDKRSASLPQHHLNVTIPARYSRRTYNDSLKSNEKPQN